MVAMVAPERYSNSRHKEVLVMNKPVLGQRVTAKDRLRRWGNFGAKQTWETFGSQAAFKSMPVSGIYIGYRTKSNGHTEFDYDCHYWVPSEYFEVWLIVETDRTNPIYVLPQDVEFANIVDTSGCK